MWKWLEDLFTEDDEVDLEDYELHCPICGSNRLGYTTVMANFVQVVNGIEAPEYEDAVRCLDCSFKAVYEDSKELLKVVKAVKRNKNE